MAKSIQVQLSFIAGRLQKLRQIGKEHRWQTSDGEIKNATVAMNIIDFILDLRHHPIYNKILIDEQCTLVELLKRILHDYAARKGYLRKDKL